MYYVEIYVSGVELFIKAYGQFTGTVDKTDVGWPRGR